MNELEIAARLREEADHLGLDVPAISRRCGLPEGRVAEALNGQPDVTVELLVQVAAGLELEVQLHPCRPVLRRAGPVPSVVDVALQRLSPGLVEPSHPQDSESNSQPSEVRTKGDAS